jgi:hypothetical protein
MLTILKCLRLTAASAVALAPPFVNAADLPRPGASAVDVRAEMGVPTTVRSAAGKKVIWEYAGTPSPYETYFLVFSKDRRLLSIRQVISDTTFAQIKPGMTRAQIHALLGTPWRITNLDDDADSEIGDILEYRGQDTSGTYKFHIECDPRGRVVVAAKVRDTVGTDRGDVPAKSTEASQPKP